ncbi:MAG: ATP-binding protein [Prevotellaceae bacterium]|jgi:predicted AAA+ superfamily ATPase|nr:ATP-binding protein [Prevotellaceae bacterium]
MEEKIIDRPYYIEKIKPYVGKPIIKILIGQRRIGKSFILKQLINSLRQSEGEQAHIIYINKELKKYENILTDNDLYEYISSRLVGNKKNYVFIDEIQEISAFQQSLRSLLAENNCDLYCTGSNANMLSGELATHLAGRYMKFPVHSLSYGEFLTFHRLNVDNASLLKYMRIGGMPYLIHLNGDESLCFEYLRSLYATILLKDVVMRKQIRNVDFMERLVYFLADNIGSLFSASNISKYLKSQRQQLPTQLVLDYSNALSQAYFLHKVSRANVHGLKIFEVGEKYYFEDLGIRNAIRGFDPLTETQKWMENLVYLHLIRLGYTVYVGSVDTLEIDFVAQKLHTRLYVQVCYRLNLESTRDREMTSLLKIGDNFPKYIVTLDDFSLGTTPEGIQIVHLKDFLLKNE